MKARLGVNIDHVATLRQARGEDYPSVVQAAQVALDSGADQITIHLREDRRHIQDTDVPAVKMVCEKMGRPLNLELGVHPEIVDIAIDSSPDWICVVPEKREERTTEGGLDLIGEENFKRVKQAMEKLRASLPKVKMSLFVEADQRTLEKCVELKADAVEIHTGDYAKDFLEGNPVEEHLAQYQKMKEFMEGSNIGYHAGHGLTDKSVAPLIEKDLFAEYNIGHWIICDSVFCGMETSIKKLTTLLNKK